MTVNLTLLVIMGVLFSVGVYLLLERSLTRVLLGIMLLTNGANLLILHTSGTPGIAPLYDAEDDDALPQDTSEFKHADARFAPSRHNEEEAAESPGHYRAEKFSEARGRNPHDH